MNILVIAPHPDDESIGCGGAICKHVAQGDAVSAVFLTSGELGLKELPREEAWRIREAEARAAAQVLGITGVEFLRCPDWMMGDDVPAVTAKLVPLLGRWQPNMIYLPHPAEWHPDHKACLPAVKEALKLAGMTTVMLRGYEVWTPLQEYQHVEDISKEMPRKLRALRRHKCQVSGWDYVRAIRGLNQYRGVMAGRCAYAEVFQDLSAA